jgi:integrase
MEAAARKPKITLTEALGRDRLIDDRTDDHLEQAYAEPIKHRRTMRCREQAWLVMVILQDCGMRPDEVFPMRIENLHWKSDRIWIPEGKTDKVRRFVAMSERKPCFGSGAESARKAGHFHPHDQNPDT